MWDDSSRDAECPEVRLEQMDWDDIHEAGSYLHIASGLIARVYPEDVAGANLRRSDMGGGAVVRLLPNPGAPMVVLREIAERHGLRVAS